MLVSEAEATVMAVAVERVVLAQIGSILWIRRAYVIGAFVFCMFLGSK